MRVDYRARHSAVAQAGATAFFIVFGRAAEARMPSWGGDAIDLFMVLLFPFGLDTPSLRLRESNATLHSEKFNIDRDILNRAGFAGGCLSLARIIHEKAAEVA